MKTILFFLISIVSLAQIGAKTKPNTNSIQGEWINTSFGFEMKLNLNQGGQGMFDEEAITYTLNGNKLIIKGQGTNETYTYQLTGNSLTLSGGDLDEAITFKRNGNQSTSTANTEFDKNNTKLDKLLGQWTTDGADLEFKANGTGLYNTKPFSYTLNGNTLISRDETGENQFIVMFIGKAMTLMGQGVNATFTRGHSGYKASQDANATSSNNNPGSSLDQSIVGKWCYISSLTSSNASSSYSRCLVINSNGTYTYNAEGSISGYGGGGYGGSSSQSADSGTWQLSGNRIYVKSRKEGQKVYTFEKRNHPKNGDPMIIIDGEAYVTFYQRKPW
ncbi:hypothetical protein EGI22_09215 [Lacihabitans sp. LS3-19]|uniref:lipocalin family protein n=1 Tax=Lacihabitans sp. LS3-19 TaxID=2487335 RepID=UPI0020CBB1F3|nr:lipocalin family protein [Lacihabitans sp. LS3-19]MCP9768092.1 hypothetical protein [Lacihabitans sp. LS3-19]